MRFSFKERANARSADRKEFRRRSEFMRFLESGATHTHDGLCFIGATLRASGKVDEVEWLVLNLDSYPPDPSIFLDSLPFEWYAYSTWNDGNANVDEQRRHRFTVLIPLRMPINTHEYRGVVKWVDRRWGIDGGLINKTVRDPGHPYFTPRAKNPESTREPWIFRRFENVPRLDPYSLPGGGDCRRFVANEAHEYGPRAEFLERQRKKIADPGLTSAQREYLDDQLRQFTLTTNDRTEALQQIETFAIRMGGYSAQYPSAFDRGTLISRIEAAAAHVVDDPGLSDWVENALDFGAEEPIRVPALERPHLRLVTEEVVNDVGRKLKGAPCPEHEIPPSYDVGPGGVWYSPPPKEGSLKEPDLRQVTSRPIVISRRYYDEDGAEWVKLAWTRGARWIERIVPRGKILNHNDLVRAIGDYGAPVHSLNAKAVVAYLQAYERHNESHFSNARIVTQMGWHNGEFLLGRTRIDAEGQHEQDDRNLVFDGTRNDTSLTDALGKGGTFEEWRKLIQPLEKYPVIAVGILASACAPLLESTRTASFVVDQGDPTSGGKSIAMSAAASLWGYPTKQDGLLASWGSTAVHLGNCAATFRHLPLFIDDRKDAKQMGGAAFVSAQVYRLTSKDKGRGSVNGARRTKSFHLVIMSNGEDNLADSITDDGARARVIGVGGAPFGEKTEHSYYIVEPLRMGLEDHYGHLGPLIVQRIARQSPEHWRLLCDEVVRHYIDLGARNAKVMRKARSFACMHIALDLINDICGWSWPVSLLEDLWREQSKDRAQRAKHELALDELRDAISSNQGSFWVGGKSRPPSGGWWGRIEAPLDGFPPDPSKHYVGIYPKVMRKALEEWWENNFLTYWVQDGICTKPTVVNLNKRSARLIKFRYSEIFPRAHVEDDGLPF